MVERFEQHPPEVRVTREEYERGKQVRVLPTALEIEKIYRLRHKMPPQVGFFALQRWVRLENVNENGVSRVLSLSFVTDDAEPTSELPPLSFSNDGYIYHDRPKIAGLRRKRVRGMQRVVGGYLLDSFDEWDSGLDELTTRMGNENKIPTLG